MASPSPPTEPYTRYVLLPRLHLERSGLCLLLDEIGDIARRVRDFRKGERRELHHPPHLPLGLQGNGQHKSVSYITMYLTSSTLRRMARNRVVRASRFLASRECPVWAPLRRSLVLVNAIRVGKMFSLGPVPDILDR